MIDATIDSRLVADLSSAEDDKLIAYQDSLGLWTIGRGHLMPAPAPGKSWAGFGISQDVSDRYFNGDIASAIAYAKKLPEFVSCDTICRQNALIELCFNMRGKWNGFTKCRTAWLAQDWQTTHDELLNSLWAKQVQPHGLDKPGRATRIANYILTGQYPT